MVTLIVTIILICSFLGILVILWRKVPLLIQLPKTEVVSTSFSFKIKEKIKSLRVIKIIPSEVFLQKILSKFRIFTLKTEQKTAQWLQKLRERSLKKKNLQSDNYWEKVQQDTKQENNNKL